MLMCIRLYVSNFYSFTVAVILLAAIGCLHVVILGFSLTDINSIVSQRDVYPLAAKFCSYLCSVKKTLQGCVFKL